MATQIADLVGANETLAGKLARLEHLPIPQLGELVQSSGQGR